MDAKQPFGTYAPKEISATVEKSPPAPRAPYADSYSQESYEPYSSRQPGPPQIPTTYVLL